VSRIPRAQEHLKTGFTAEAVAAARFRAYAVHAERDGLPNLGAHWRRLAAEKDRLAIAQLEAAGQVRGAGADIDSAIADERYENDVLYPKMRGEVDDEVGGTFESVIAAQRGHLDGLVRLRDRYNAARGDVDLPAEVDSAK
jgi:rubrerythrin